MVEILGLLGGALAGSAARKTAEANVKAAQIDARQRAANQEKGLAALTGSDAFKTTTRNAAGGFDVTQPGGGDAAKARELSALGDVERARRLNEAQRNFQFTLPTLSDARGIIAQDRALQQGQFDKGISDIVSQRQRLGQGLNATNFEGGTVDAIKRFTDANRFGGERDALDLFAKSKAADLANLSALRSVNAPTVPAPGFTTGGPGGTAANVIAQTPPPAAVADLTSTVPFAAGANIIAQLQRQQAAERDRQSRSALLDRFLNNQNANLAGSNASGPLVARQIFPTSSNDPFRPLFT